MNHAITILRHAPDLADAIVFGNAKFDLAYQEAKQRKEIKVRNEFNQAKHQNGGPDGQQLWAKVQDENDPLTLDAAIIELDRRHHRPRRRSNALGYFVTL